MKLKKCCIWLLLLLMANCVFAQTPFIYPVEIDYNNPEKYLTPGIQSTIDEKYLAEIKSDISISKPDIEGVGEIYFWMMKNFTVFSGKGSEIGKNTIDKLLNRKAASGCHDHGLIFSSVLRYFGYPAIMVDATGIEWAEHADPKKPLYGHIFIEIFVNGKWILADSNSGEYIENYDPNDPVIPITKSVESKGYYVLYKGTDPAGYGLESRDALHNLMFEFAGQVRKMKIQYPPYVISSFKKVPDNRKNVFVLGEKTPTRTYAQKYAPASRTMAAIYLQPNDPYDMIVYLKTPETRSTDYVTNLFQELNKTETNNYICIKKINGKMLIYFNGENEAKLLEMVDKFGEKVDLKSLEIIEEEYIVF